MMTSLRSCARYPSGGTPPIHTPFFFEAAILSRMRSPMTSRSNCAKDNRTFRVKRPIELVVLNCCVTETKDAPLATGFGEPAALRLAPAVRGAMRQTCFIAPSAKSPTEARRAESCARLCDCGGRRPDYRLVQGLPTCQVEPGFRQLSTLPGGQHTGLVSRSPAHGVD